ncbi:hypothetical protein HK099_002778 [Clydaea vesicula]|uniref:Uncharacterized protein n=1 Tax=Clydaea vesicula TaxID=447962 RepID=A0AAD5Y177_9FUNG|nr:hypothetical protein HK099_002778 [Clydaea vesicula]
MQHLANNSNSLVKSDGAPSLPLYMQNNIPPELPLQADLKTSPILTTTVKHDFVIKVTEVSNKFVTLALLNKWVKSFNELFPITVEVFLRFINYEAIKLFKKELDLNTFKKEIEYLVHFHSFINCKWWSANVRYHPIVVRKFCTIRSTLKKLKNQRQLNRVDIFKEKGYLNDIKKDCIQKLYMEGSKCNYSNSDSKRDWSIILNTLTQLNCETTNNESETDGHDEENTEDYDWLIDEGYDFNNSENEDDNDQKGKGFGYKKLAVSKGWCNADNIFPISLENILLYIDHELNRIKKRQLTIGSLKKSISVLASEHRALGLNWDKVRFHELVCSKLKVQKKHKRTPLPVTHFNVNETDNSMRIHDVNKQNFNNDNRTDSASVTNPPTAPQSIQSNVVDMKNLTANNSTTTVDSQHVSTSQNNSDFNLRGEGYEKMAVFNELERINQGKYTLSSLKNAVSVLASQHRHLGMEWDHVRFHPQVRLKLGMRRQPPQKRVSPLVFQSDLPEKKMIGNLQ